MVPPSSPPPLPPIRDDRRVLSFQLALSFLLGAASALGGVKLYESRSARPLEQPFGDHYRIDLNRASAQDIAQLPRVGPALADRIVAARPLNSLNDLDHIPGIGPKAVEKLKPLVAVPDSGHTSYSAKPATATVIEINLATLEQLQTLPGIGPKLAQRIIDARTQRPFTSVEDLRRVPGIGPKTLEKLRPWVHVVIE